MKKLILLCSTAVAFPTAGFAQSTGSVDFEKETIVVTGTRIQEVGGVQSPDTPKAKAVLTQEIIGRQNPGQTILDTINLVPGVSFQNNDAYGSSGGTLNIRGFDSSRVSLTFDGIPLNDSGNYAIYSNQQLDPELIEQVNVNLGTTDVDSPTASAVGGTVNYRTILPAKEFSGTVSGSIGQFDFRRIFGVIHTGEIGPWGTRAFISASTAKNDNPFNNYGKVDKQQYNARIYQPIGSNGDFISVAGHYNQNRNNFFGSLPLRTDTTRLVGGVPVPRIVGPNSQNRYPITKGEREYDINFPCTVDTPQAGGNDTPGTTTGPGAPANDPNGDYATCGTEFDRRYNPSNTGNIRGSSKFTLAEGVVLTVDPSFQYVKANGGGTSTAREFGYDIDPTGGRANCNGIADTPEIKCVAGYFGGSPYFDGVDLNGDGDTRDQVSVLTPSQTQTHRIGVIAGVRWDINDDHTVRISYTYDHAKHRQTGEVGLLDENGEPLDVFPVNDPLVGASGVTLQKRDRKSFAILNQVSGEWRGQFLDDTLTLNVGVRAPFFTRKLDNRCYTSSASGFVECSGGDEALDDLIGAENPYTFNPDTGLVTGFSPPGKRTLKYDKLLPNLGFVYDITQQISVFASYAKGISVPGTDNLYNAFYYPEGTDQAKPRPEITNSFDLGLRYRSSKIQAQFSVWKTKFTDRLASAYDPELNATVYRNLGTVNKWGIDGSFAYAPIKELTLYAFGSWNQSKIKDNIRIGNAIADCDNIPGGALLSNIIKSCALTAGNREAGTPKYTYGLSALASVGPVDFGLTGKRTGPRYIFDNNAVMYETGVNLTTLDDANLNNNPRIVYGATAPAYWLLNLDARLKLGYFSKTLDKAYFQVNVYNLLDKFYVGGFGGGLNQALNTAATQFGNPPFVQIGAPRTVSGTLVVGF